MQSRTVTLYRKTGEGVLRQVVENCYFQQEKRRHRDNEGAYLQSDFLLIVPDGVVLQVGDRILPEVGPADVSGEALQIGWVKPYVVDGVLSHTEAGGGL